MRNLTLNLTNLSLVLLVMGLSAIEAGAQDSGVQKRANSKAKSAGSYAAEVTASRLHLRSGPGGSYQSVVLAEQGDKLIVRDAAAGGWAIIEVPGGFNAWVNARYVDRGSDGIGVVKVQNLLVRPRPSTRYHQLAAKLNKGEKLKVLAAKSVGDESWLQVRVPQRVPLYGASRFLTKIGPVSLAVPKAEEAKAVAAKKAEAANLDASFIVIEKKVLAQLRGARTLNDLRPIQRSVASVDDSKLSNDHQRRHIALQRKLLDREREFVVASVSEHEKRHLAELEGKIKAIEAKYRKRLREIEDQRAAKKREKNRFTAVGIIEHKPDLLGRTPAFRITKGGKLRYYVIAPAFDLHKFAGKRVGLIGLLDRESGTGYFTIMAKRLEIIADK